MSYKHPLNLEVKEASISFDSGASRSLSFSYESGGKRDFIAYNITDQENLDRYMNRENLGKIDLSAVKNEEDAQKFTEKFMEKYPEPQDVYKHLFELTSLHSKSSQDMDLHGFAHSTVEFSAMRYAGKENAAEGHAYVKELLQAMADGKSIKDIPVEASRLVRWGLKKDPSYEYKRETKSFFEKAQENYPESKAYAQKILKKFPEKAFKNAEESCEFVDAVVWGSEGLRFKQNEDLKAAIKKVGGDFVDIVCKEAASTALDRKIKAHLKQLKVAAKLKSRQEERKAAKDKMIAENQESWKEEQKKTADKKAARKRLAEKGLVAEAGSKSGKDVHWGDSPKLRNGNSGR